ncbi:MAG: hypothetical protein LBT79_04260 [Elusimicrobiota bacterium]|jgi:hypothetical protein|nr:hypothetical protein [Elusimicrobiota bacterium]
MWKKLLFGLSLFAVSISFMGCAKMLGMEDKYEVKIENYKNGDTIRYDPYDNEIVFKAKVYRKTWVGFTVVMKDSKINWGRTVTKGSLICAFNGTTSSSDGRISPVLLINSGEGEVRISASYNSMNDKSKYVSASSQIILKIEEK